MNSRARTDGAKTGKPLPAGAALSLKASMKGRTITNTKGAKRRKRSAVFMPGGTEFLSHHLDLPRIKSKAKRLSPNLELFTNTSTGPLLAETTANAYWEKIGFLVKEGRHQERRRKLGGDNTAAARKKEINERNRKILAKFDSLTEHDPRNRAEILARLFHRSASQIRRIIKKARMR